MADSLSAECSPLKQAYDSCFNVWFEDYLDRSSRGTYSKEKADEFESKCRILWISYKDCVQKSLKEKGLDNLLQQARNEYPFGEPVSLPQGVYE